jgi:undecaprenyl-diphosphatase
MGNKIHNRLFCLQNTLNLHITLIPLIMDMNCLQYLLWSSPIESIDRQLFFFINKQVTHPVLDVVLLYMREASVWVPLYLFFIVLVWLNFGIKGLWWILVAICTAALSDMISSSFVKGNILRLRPCRDTELAHQVRILANYCPINSSFTSSHATNHFAFAMFVVATLKKHTTRWLNLLFWWAGIICYAQVYVGVHYPLDVLCGALLGCGLGGLTALFFNKKIGLNYTPILDTND